MPVAMPILLHAVATEPHPGGNFIDKEHLLKWIYDVLEQTKPGGSLAIAYLEDLRDYLLDTE